MTWIFSFVFFFFFLPYLSCQFESVWFALRFVLLISPWLNKHHHQSNTITVICTHFNNHLNEMTCDGTPKCKNLLPPALAFKQIVNNYIVMSMGYQYWYWTFQSRWQQLCHWHFWWRRARVSNSNSEKKKLIECVSKNKFHKMLIQWLWWGWWWW